MPDHSWRVLPKEQQQGGDNYHSRERLARHPHCGGRTQEDQEPLAQWPGQDLVTSAAGRQRNSRERPKGTFGFPSQQLLANRWRKGPRVKLSSLRLRSAEKDKKKERPWSTHLIKIICLSVSSRDRWQTIYMTDTSGSSTCKYLFKGLNVLEEN